MSANQMFKRLVAENANVKRVKNVLDDFAANRNVLVKYEYDGPVVAMDMWDDTSEYIRVYVPEREVKYFKRCLRSAANRPLVHKCNDDEIFWRVEPNTT